MAHDPRKEDYQRLALRYALELDDGDPAGASRAFMGFGQRFARDRDSLPQTDSDRAFHLVVRATKLIDYELPFATDESAKKLIQRARDLLEEAVTLDAHCYDAIRMLQASQAPSMSQHYRYLAEHEAEVRDYCHKQADDYFIELHDERNELAQSIAIRPWLRWQAAMAEEALICGHNHDAARICRETLQADPSDISDVRFTLAYALAKLEDADGFDELLAHYPTPAGRNSPDAWLLVSRLAFAHKCCDFDRARSVLDELISSYAGAATVLIRQNEIADGAFARLRVAPYSEDELVLALSEGVVLLQEGADYSGRGVLGNWVAQQVAASHPEAAMEALSLSIGEAMQ